MADAADPALAAQSMLADLQRTNPQLAMLAQMMQARAIVPEPAGPDLGEEITVLAEQLADAQRQVAIVKREGRRLLTRYREATDRLSLLAAALGACGLCWGDDDLCPSCRGRGAPGMVRPDPAARARVFGVKPQPAPAPPTPVASHH
ncbi:hypothetical protein [Sphingomonas sp.]|uniref:hypothetical protein n=1 Tax=Sphingomonas sp. TaxID=28214 RepID=UPI001E1637B1|nr:hypothetical protein [Sphingomonas sp.]MBX9797457.1 hypothetical protein [Sphingomonas sp.]